MFSLLHLKSIGVYFQTEDGERTVKTNRNTASSLWRNVEWHEPLRFSLSMVYQNWNKVGVCGHNFSSSILYDNVLWIESLHFTFLSIHPKGKIWTKKDHITAKESENGEHKSENLIQASLKYLTNKRFTKYYLTLNIQSVHIKHFISVWIPSKILKFIIIRNEASYV